jgi:hypothetical protein
MDSQAPAQQYSCAVVQTIKKLHENEFLILGTNVCQQCTGWLLLFTVSQLRQLTHKDNTRTVFMLSTFIKSLCDNYLIMNWKCQVRSCSDVIRSVNRQRSNEIQNKWIWGFIWNRDFPKSELIFSQWTVCVAVLTWQTIVWYRLHFL